MIPGVERLVVSLVCRAGYLLGAGLGPQIDAAEVVVRVNWTLPLPDNAPDFGARTDLLYHCVDCTAQRDAATAQGVRAHSCDWRLRKRLAKRSRLDYRKYRPNTGTVAVFDLLGSGVARVDVFGMDFYRTGVAAATAPWNGNPDKVLWRHQPPEDAALLRRLALPDPRFRPDARLRAAVELAA